MAPGRLGFWQRMAAAVVKPVLAVWTKPTWRGAEHLPKSGGFIVAPNHVSHFDPLTSAHYLYDHGVWPRFLAKASVFRVPLVGRWLLRVKQIPVERGTAEAVRSLDTLVAAIREGGAVVIYPEGTTTRDPELWPMRGKTGAARLALATGVPVIPLTMWGPQEIFDPRTARLRFRPRVPVTVVAGPPVDLSRWLGAEATKATLDEMTDAIMLRLRDQLAEIRGGTPPPLWVPQGGNTPPRQRRAGLDREAADRAGPDREATP